MMRFFVPVFLASLVWAGCSGELVVQPVASGEVGAVCASIDECQAGLRCTEGLCATVASGCSPVEPEGACATEASCVGGVCLPDGVGAGACDCEANQACVLGACLPIDEENRCRAENPGGLCPSGFACVAGACTRLDETNSCTEARPAGLCPPGAACLRGQCVPLDTRPCSSDAPDGLCPSGEACTDGACAPIACSTLNPGGRCPTGDSCQDGRCQARRCSVFDPDGDCPEGRYCSVVGECLPNETCGADDDCSELEKCAPSVQRCLDRGSCREDGDCDGAARCNPTTERCERDLSCTSGTDCLPNEDCVASLGRCAPAGTCTLDGDCPLPEFCGSNGFCLEPGRCADGVDCVAPAFCSSAGNCRADGECDATDDCRPGFRCDSTTNLCETVNEVACTATLQTSGCTDAGSECCPTDEVCCASTTSRCNVSSGACVPLESCLENNDCPAGFSCDGDALCAVDSPCASDGECGSGTYCSAAGGCVPNGTCVTSADCATGLSCGSSFTCVVGESCGATEFEVELVQPNLVVLLDRSGSMNDCDPDEMGVNQNRWEVALAAIDTMLGEFEDRIRFGLSTYPTAQGCGDIEQCNPGCNNNCKNGCAPPGAFPPFTDANDNCQPGRLDVAPAENNRAAINGSLAFPNNEPGGRTPTAVAMTTIRDDAASYGLADPDRDNFLMHITDGDPAGCGDFSFTNNDAAVTNAVGDLAALSPAVRTFVVGFAFNTVKSSLNCQAVAGDTSRCGDDVDPGNCNATGQECYYRADLPSQLVAALELIAGEVLSCEFRLDRRPPSLDRLFFYLSRSGQEDELISDDSGAGTYYQYDPIQNTVEFFGAGCDEIKAQTAAPTVIFGCAQSG